MPDDARATYHLPRGLEVAVAWTWRLAVLVGGVVLLFLALQRVLFLSASLLGALLLTALLQPLAAVLCRRAGGGRRAGRAAGAGVLVAFVVVVSAVLLTLGAVVAAQLPDVATALSQGADQLLERLRAAGVDVGPDRREQLRARLAGSLGSGGGALLASALSALGTLLNVLSGAFLALFVALVLLVDGQTVWRWLLRVLPREAQEPAHQAGVRAWGALTGYMRGIVVVALTDATLIAVALLLIGVPSVLPLAVLTFLGAFLPYVGAAAAGLVAVVVALVAVGPAAALLTVGAVLLVQTLDGYVVEPLVLGRAVRLHPLAVVVVITLGGLLAGIGGAVVAVPLAGAVNEAATYLARRGRDTA